MHYHPQEDSADAHKFVVRVCPNGRITVPKIIRDRLGVKPKDKVVVRLYEGKITITPMTSSLESIYQVAGSLKDTRSDRDMTGMAWDEHAQKAVQEDESTRRPE